MGRITDTGRAQRGLDFLRGRPSIWVGLGRTSPWPDEQNPPEVNRQKTALDELFAMKLIDDGFLVVPAEDGNIIGRDGKLYRQVTAQEGLDLQTPYLCLRFIIETDEFALISYRQIGVFVDSIPAEGFSSFTALTPDKFQSLGRLYYLDNGPLETRYPNTRHEIIIVTVPEASGPEA